MGHRQALALGQRSRRKSLAHHGRHQDRWDGKEKWPDGGCCSNGVLAIVDQQVGLQSYAGPGPLERSRHARSGQRRNDRHGISLSLQPVGDAAAPLIAGNDLRNMRPEIHDILTNKEVIAVDQDALGREGERVAKNGDLEVWAKQLKDGSRAVVLLNRGSAEQEISANWEDLGYPAELQRVGARSCGSTRIWESSRGNSQRAVASHGVVMVTVKP